MNNDRAENNNMVGYNAKNALNNQKHFNQMNGIGKSKHKDNQIKFLLKLLRKKTQLIIELSRSPSPNP